MVKALNFSKKKKSNLKLIQLFLKNLLQKISKNKRNQEKINRKWTPDGLLFKHVQNK